MKRHAAEAFEQVSLQRTEGLNKNQETKEPTPKRYKTDWTRLTIYTIGGAAVGLATACAASTVTTVAAPAMAISTVTGAVAAGMTASGLGDRLDEIRNQATAMQQLNDKMKEENDRTILLKDQRIKDLEDRLNRMDEVCQRAEESATRWMTSFQNKVIQVQDVTCRVCYENATNTKLVPCGHVALCTDCAQSLLEHPCPFCKIDIQDVEPIFIP